MKTKTITTTCLLIVLALYSCEGRQSPNARYVTNLSVFSMNPNSDYGPLLDRYCYNNCMDHDYPDPCGLFLIPHGEIQSSVAFEYQGRLDCDGMSPAGVAVRIEVLEHSGTVDVWETLGKIATYDEAGNHVNYTQGGKVYARTGNEGYLKFLVILGDDTIYGKNEEFKLRPSKAITSFTNRLGRVDTKVKIKVSIPGFEDCVQPQQITCNFLRYQGQKFKDTNGFYRMSTCTSGNGYAVPVNGLEVLPEETSPPDSNYPEHPQSPVIEPNDIEPVWPRYYEVESPMFSMMDGVATAVGWWDWLYLEVRNGYEHWSWLTYGHEDLTQMSTYICPGLSDLRTLATFSSPYVYWTYYSGDIDGAPNRLMVSLDIKNTNGVTVERMPVTMWRADYYGNYPPIEGVAWYCSDRLVPMQEGSLSGVFNLRGKVYRCFTVPEGYSMQIIPSVDFNIDGIVDLQDFAALANANPDVLDVIVFGAGWLKGDIE